MCRKLCKTAFFVESGIKKTALNRAEFCITCIVRSLITFNCLILNLFGVVSLEQLLKRKRYELYQ